MMSICLTWFPISGLGKPKFYQNLVGFARMWEDCGQSSVTATSAYLGVSDNSALELARSINV